jgi:hypothetical protein
LAWQQVAAVPHCLLALPSRIEYRASQLSEQNPIFPDLARDRIVDGPNQLWVADITYIADRNGIRLSGRNS